ncbi:hypothetical protein, partial [Streptomyces europaeiscabiei]|uniref:hypothetical protein n=1 Tax=Streptomyces europaeiscabiei TaxID=146819 RepID=UPI0038F63674
TALKMMGKLPGKLEPALNSGLLGKFFPNLRLDIGCLKTPVEGLSIVDASGNVLRDSKMTMGDLLKLADKDPASLKSTLKVTDSAKYLNSLDTFSDVALRRQADARNYNILRNVVRGTKVFALLAGLAGTAYLIH